MYQWQWRQLFIYGILLANKRLKFCKGIAYLELNELPVKQRSTGRVLYLFGNVWKTENGYFVSFFYLFAQTYTHTWVGIRFSSTYRLPIPSAFVCSGTFLSVQYHPSPPVAYIAIIFSRGSIVIVYAREHINNTDTFEIFGNGHFWICDCSTIDNFQTVLLTQFHLQSLGHPVLWFTGMFQRLWAYPHTCMHT